MKLHTLLLGAVVFSNVVLAEGFSAGTWRLADARCSEASYVPTEEEQAFIAWVKSGITIDRYRFDAGKGEYETRFAQGKASCIGRASLAVEYLPGSVAKLKFGAMRWESKSDDPLVHIDCSSDDKAREETWPYEIKGDELAFVQRSDAKCGQFKMIWRRETRANATPRVESRPCAGAGETLRGRGFAFGFEGKSYVVAPQSRVYHSENFCHSVDGAPAKLVAVEWGNGLALLEVPGRAPLEGWPSFAHDPKSADTVGGGGKLLAVKSPRQYYPLVVAALEVDKLPVHADDVGAPLLSATGEIVGVVSQYYLKIEPGHPTRVAEWSPKDAKVQSRTIAIPGAVIENWLAPLREHRPFARQFRVSADDQAKGLRRVAAADLLFEEIAPPPAGAPTPDGDFPIGGGDGVGVGGGAGLESHAKLRVTTLPQSVSDYDFGAQKVWHDRAKGAGVLEVPFVFDRYRTFNSTAEFFSVLAREPKVTIATLREHADEKYTKLRELSLSLARECYLYYRAPTFTDERVLDLVRQLYLSAKLLDSESKNVTPAELASLLDRDGVHRREWALLLAPVASHQKMHDALARLTEEWRRLNP